MKTSGRSTWASISGFEEPDSFPNVTAMKQTLQLKLSQHLTLTPQLQQSIRLLQLSTLELNAGSRADAAGKSAARAGRRRRRAAAAADERRRHADARPSPSARRPRRRSDEDADDDARERTDDADCADFERLVGSGDGDWGGGSGDDDDDFYPQQVATSSLRDHLIAAARAAQPAAARPPDRRRADRRARRRRLPARRRSRSSPRCCPTSSRSSPTSSRSRSSYLQSFEPAGVGARDCAECLALQLKALPADTPYRAEALKLVDRAPARCSPRATSPS